MPYVFQSQNRQTPYMGALPSLSSVMDALLKNVEEKVLSMAGGSYKINQNQKSFVENAFSKTLSLLSYIPGVDTAIKFYVRKYLERKWPSVKANLKKRDEVALFVSDKKVIADIARGKELMNSIPATAQNAALRVKIGTPLKRLLASHLEAKGWLESEGKDMMARASDFKRAYQEVSGGAVLGELATLTIVLIIAGITSALLMSAGYFVNSFHSKVSQAAVDVKTLESIFSQKETTSLIENLIKTKQITPDTGLKFLAEQEAKTIAAKTQFYQNEARIKAEQGKGMMDKLGGTATKILQFVMIGGAIAAVGYVAFKYSLVSKGKSLIDRERTNIRQTEVTQ